MGQTLRGSAQDGRGRRRAIGLEGGLNGGRDAGPNGDLFDAVKTALKTALKTAFKTAVKASLFVCPLLAQDAPERLDRGRFAFLYFPQDRGLAASLAALAIRTDSFPGLARPRQQVVIAIAPDRRRFREWVGDAVPEWGSAAAFPESRRIVLQGRAAGSDAGDPLVVLRHELAHLALHEFLGDLPPRWFDEGYASYAAGEWGREEVLATNIALALRGMPTLEELDASFSEGNTAAQSAYALAHRAVSQLAAGNPASGLTPFLRYWRESRSFERALRQAYGMTSTDFERQWRQRTRRQYGALALASNMTLGVLLMLAILTPLYLSRRRRDKRRLERMREADAAAEVAARQSALDDLLGEPPERHPPS